MLILFDTFIPSNERDFVEVIDYEGIAFIKAELKNRLYERWQGTGN